MSDVDVASRAAVVLGVTGAIHVLSSIFVLMRMISRIGIVRRIALDDYFMVLAWFLAFGLSFSICYGTKVGLGRHEANIPPEWNAPLKKAQYAFSILYNPSLMATKTSILVLYLSLARGNKIFRNATITTLLVVNLAGFALTMLNAFQCRPISATFETPIPKDAMCLDIVTLYLSSAPVNIITDLAILFLPMPILTGMQLPRKQKTILVITFGFGFFVTIVDVIRIAYLQGAQLKRLEADNYVNGAEQRNTWDVSWNASFSYMWSAVEVNVGIMCANVPGLKPLVSRFMPYILRDKGQTKSRSTGREEHNIPSHEAPGQEAKSASGAVPAIAYPQEGTASAARQNVTHNEEPEDDAIDMLDFLTTPEMGELPPNLQESNPIQPRRPPSPRFFDFVIVEKKRSLLRMTNRESLFPITMVTILFFLWGVAYGFLDTLNAQFQRVAQMTQGQTIGIHSAYFAAYTIGSLIIGRPIFKRWGFKACYISGLFIYACGTLVFWPSAVLTSFPAFLVSNFIVGLGLSLLELAANPYVALCGPPEWMELRLTLCQAIQAIGTVASPLLASRVLLKERSKTSLIDVQWTYLGLALFTVLLAVAYYYLPLPETTDEDLEETAEHPDLLNLAEIKGTKLVLITLAVGTMAQFCNVGAQEALSTSVTVPKFLKEYLQINVPVSAAEFPALGHCTFAGARFISAFLNLFIKPRIILMGFYLGAIASSIAAMKLRGEGAEAALLLLYFFEGPIFPIIFAISLRGLGRYTKDGAAFLTASIGGGGVLQPIMYGLSRKQPQLLHSSYRVIVTAWCISALFAVYLNFFPLARKMADPVKPRVLPTEANGNAEPALDGSDRRSWIAMEAIIGPKTNGPSASRAVPRLPTSSNARVHPD